MTIASATPSYIQIPGNGTATIFAFPFKIFAATDLLVGFVTSSGYTQQSGGFTVQNVDINGGGDVLFAIAPPSGTTVDVRTDTPLTQNTEFANLGAFLPEAHTEAFDRLTRQIQDLFRRTYTFGIHGPDSENTPWPALPPQSARALMTQMYDINGLPTLGTPVAGTITQAIIGALLYPQLSWETGVVNTSYPYNMLMRFGVDPTGTNDSTAALQACLNSAAASGESSTVTVGFFGANLKIGSAWTIDTNKTGIDFQGAFINATGFAPGSVSGWCTPIQSSTDPNQRPLLNKAHPIKGFLVQGPGVANANAIALYLNDTNPVGGSDYNVSGVVADFATLNFGQDVVFGNGAFCCDISLSAGATGGGTATTYSVTQQSAVNSGERNVLSNYWCFNKAYGVQNLSGSAELVIGSASIDGAITAINNNDGTIVAQFVHLEGSTDTAAWINNTATNGRIKIGTLDIVLDAAKSATPIGNCDASVTWGGVDIDVVNFSAAGGYGTLGLFSGTGNVRVGKIYGLGTAAGQPQFSSLAENLLSDPIFASNGFTADGWTASGSAAPTVEGTAPYSGTKDVKFATTGAQTSILTSRIIPCKPMQSVFCQLQVKMPTWNTSASFTALIAYVRQDGSALTSVIGGTTGTGFQFMSLAAVSSAYAPQSCAVSGGIGRAPPGTVGVQLTIELQGATAIAYLGQAIVDVK